MKIKYFVIVGLLLAFVFGSVYGRNKYTQSTLIFQGLIHENGWEITKIDVQEGVNVSSCATDVKLPYKIPSNTAFAMSIAECYMLVPTEDAPGIMGYIVEITLKNTNTDKSMWCSVDITCPVTTSVTLGAPCTYEFKKHNLDWKTNLFASKKSPNVTLQVQE